MKHKTTGLARPCNVHDIFISGNGLQCSNCLAYEEKESTDNQKHLQTWLNFANNITSDPDKKKFMDNL